MTHPHPEDELPSSALTYVLGVVVTLVLIAIAAVAYVVMQPGEPPSRPDAPPPPTASTPQPPPPEAPASLMTLTSTPPGATVFAGPLELGTTPVGLDMLEPGKDYRLRPRWRAISPKRSRSASIRPRARPHATWRSRRSSYLRS